jgi:secreted trypsin-like serine protease
MRDKNFTIYLLLTLFLGIMNVSAEAQLFDANISEIKSSSHEKHYTDPVEDFLKDPDNLEYFLSQFKRGAYDKIVGGDDADIQDYPWQVSMQLRPPYGSQHFCGGTILSEEWILTASHCLVFDDGNGGDLFLEPFHLRVRAGFTHMQNPSQGGYYNVAEVIMHPDYDTNPNDFRFDIALVRLADPINLNLNNHASVNIVTMDDAQAGMTDPDVLASVSGWGALYSDGPSPNTLQAVDVPIIDVSDTSYPSNLITADMILAGDQGKDACQGDSGGPLVVDDGNDWYKVAGVVSFGVGCGSPGFPGAYARVSYFNAWLKDYLIFPDPNQYYEQHHEDFAGGNIPANWENNVISGPTGFTGWEWTLTGGAYGGQLNSTTADNGYLILDSDANGTTGAAEEVDLITGAYNFSDITTTINFSVEHLARTYGSAETYIYISTDNFATQTLLYEWEGAPQNEFNGPNPTISQFDITDLAQGETNVKFKFKWIGQWDYWWLIDDVRIHIENTPLEVQFIVTDGEEGIDNVLINTQYTDQETTTDEDGTATMVLYEGDYEITALRNGYLPYIEDITITEDGQVIEIIMEKIPAPEIVIDPQAVAIDVMQGFDSHTELSISNPGDAALVFALYVLPVFDKQIIPETTLKQAITYDGYEVNAPLQHDSKPKPSQKHPLPNAKAKPDQSVEVHHDNGYDSGVGTNSAASFITAARFTADELAEYYGSYEISAIKFHIRTGQFSEVHAKIWEGGSLDGPTQEIYSADVTEEVLIEDWTIHELPELLSMIPGEEYWFGYAIETTGGFPASVDDGPMVQDKGAWMFFNDSWAQLTEINPQLNFNFNIRAILDPVLGVEWLNVDPASGTVEPEGEQIIDLYFDAEDLDLGHHQAEIAVTNNTGDVIYVPVNMNVVEPYFNVNFEVNNTSGDPITEAIITLGDTSNEAGDYTFLDVLTGTYDYNISMQGYLEAAGNLMVVDQEVTVQVSLIPDDATPGSLTVNINDEFSEPVVGALFNLHGFGSFITDEQGQIQITIVDGQYDYVASTFGMEESTGTINISGDETLNLTMDYLRYNVTLVAQPEEGGLVNGAGEYYHGETATVIADAAEFYDFSHWSIDDNIVSYESEYSLHIFEDTHLEAFFDIHTYIINTTAMPSAGGNVDGAGEYEHGSMVTLTAIPANGYEFVEWTEDGESIAEAGNIYAFEAVMDRDLVAHFELTRYTLTFDIRAEDMQPIMDAVIKLEGVDFEEGEYVFEELLPGTYNYVVTKDGFFDATGQVSIINQHVTHQVVMDVDDTSLTEVTWHGIRLFPNPASSILNIAAETQIKEIQIMDTTGRTLLFDTPGQSRVQLPVHELKTGFYLIRIITSQHTTTQKFQKH